MAESSSSEIRVSSSMSLPPGKVVAGRYEVLEAIGEGGMGTVCKARDVETDDVVALKFLKTGSEDPTLLERFTREARAAMSVRHPSVVEVFEVVEE